MVIRRAHPDEGERLREITAAAKGFWGYDAERVRAWAASLDLAPQRLAAADAFVVEADGGAIGWAELLPPDGGVCVLEHLWVDPAWMRRGAGSALFRRAAEHAAGRTRSRSMRGWAAGPCARSPPSGGASSP